MPRGAEWPLRIRLEHTRFPHWGGHSGYPAFARFLDSSRFDATLHGASDSDDDLPLPLTPLRPRLRRFIRRGGMPWYKLSDLRAEARAFGACLAGRADIVHFLDGEHAPQFLPGWLKRARRCSVQVIATFHQPPGLLPDLVDPDVVRRLDHALLVSPSQRRFFASYLPDDRIHVLLHGVDAEFFRPSAEPRRNGGLRCITVGNWLRDWQIVREVAARMPEVTFDVVTGRTTGLNGLANVQIHKALSDDALAELYRRADVLLLPLLESTANNALLEGIASGLPVVATDLSSVRAYMAAAEAILVPPGSWQGFLSALSRLDEAPEERAKLGALARTRAEKLAWPVHAKAYEALYRKISSGAASR